METRNLTCIGCPMGCPLTVKIENGTVLSVEGNTCKRGAIEGGNRSDSYCNNNRSRIWWC